MQKKVEHLVQTVEELNEKNARLTRLDQKM